MADEDKVEGQDDKVVVPAAAPALDMDALGKVVGDQVRAGMQQVLAAQPPREEAVVEPDAFESVVNPVIDKRVGKALAQANFAAQASADRADFYTTSDPDELAERIEYKEEIEKRFDAMARVGRAMPRVDLLNHLRGEKLDEFTSKRTKRKAAREDAARDLQDVDGAVRQRGGQHFELTADRAYSLQAEDKLDKTLDGKAF